MCDKNMGISLATLTFVGLVFTTALGGEDHKRLVLHGEGDVAASLQLMSTQIAELAANLSATTKDLAAITQELAATKQQLLTQASTFIRWGRTSCPNNTDLEYTGFTAGSLYSEAGGGAEYICASDDPIWGHYNSVDNPYGSNLYGTEYQFGEQGHRDGGTDFFGQNVYEHDAPCCLCRSNFPTTVMVPGRNECYPGWTIQYAGYLVSDSARYSASNFVCLDSRPEIERGDIRNDNGQLIYTVEAICGSLKCPLYVQYREVTCVVCSK